MKIVRFSDSYETRYGLLEGITINGLKNSPFDEGWNKNSPEMDGSSYKINEISLLTPCVPTKYIGIGLNYVETAKILGLPIPERPILFLKPTSSIIGSGEDVIFPAEKDAEVVFEGELAVVIGKKGKNIKEKDALSYVFGCTCANDVSDMSKVKIDNGNTIRVKCADTFGPIGPCISTVVDPENAEIRTWVNGKLLQQGNTKDLVFNVRFLISYLSTFMTLMPGDLIVTGTPTGAIPVYVGDVAKVEIEGVGMLENTLVSHR